MALTSFISWFLLLSCAPRLSSFSHAVRLWIHLSLPFGHGQHGTPFTRHSFSLTACLLRSRFLSLFVSSFFYEIVGTVPFSLSWRRYQHVVLGSLSLVSYGTCCLLFNASRITHRPRRKRTKKLKTLRAGAKRKDSKVLDTHSKGPHYLSLEFVSLQWLFFSKRRI